jgi:hypothetical protein
MTGRRSGSAWVLAAAAVALATTILYGHERGRLRPADPDEVLYVRSPELASRLFLSFDALAADVYWMRAIQHYGQSLHAPDDTRRFEHLAPFLDLATTLDPRFNVAYRFGAILLALDPPVGPGDVAGAIGLLAKGLAANPGRWEYAHDIGFIHYWHTGRFALAADWFDRASAVPGAPEWLGPLAALTRARGGNRSGARTLLLGLQRSEEAYIRRAADRALLQLQALEDIDRLAGVVRAYEERTGRRADGFDDLVRAGLLHAAPVDPAGRPYGLSRIDGKVQLAPDSPLNPLPTVLIP